MSELDDLFVDLRSVSSENDLPSISVVRLDTSAYMDERGVITLKKTIRPLKRKSSGYQLLQEDVHNLDALEVTDHIVNLYDVKDGVYEVITCNASRDWETGYVEDYDYQLVPYPPAPQPPKP